MSLFIGICTLWYLRGMIADFFYSFQILVFSKIILDHCDIFERLLNFGYNFLADGVKELNISFAKGNFWEEFLPIKFRFYASQELLFLLNGSLQFSLGLLFEKSLLRTLFAPFLGIFDPLFLYFYFFETLTFDLDKFSLIYFLVLKLFTSCWRGVLFIFAFFRLLGLDFTLIELPFSGFEITNFGLPFMFCLPVWLSSTLKKLLILVATFGSAELSRLSWTRVVISWYF